LGQALDLRLRPVAALVVLGRVGAEAVDEALDKRRPSARARPRDSFLGDGVAGDRIAPIDSDAREAVAGRALGDVLDRVLLVERSRDRKAVVLADEDLRQLVYGREVEGLVGVAFGP